MLLEKIPLGKTLEIIVEREDYRYRLVSKVEDTNDRRVCVTAIASNGRFFHFEPQDRLTLIYRSSEVMWMWDHVESGLAKLDGYPVHYFQIKDKGRTFNRRNAYRVNLFEEVLFGYYLDPDTGLCYSDVPLVPEHTGMTNEEVDNWLFEASKKHKVKGMIKDVSETGVGIYCDAEFGINDSIFFDIPSAYGNLSVQALIVRKNKMDSRSNRYDFYYGCVLTQSDRRLTRYIFEMQREFLKKQKASEGR